MLDRITVYARMYELLTKSLVVEGIRESLLGDRKRIMLQISYLETSRLSAIVNSSVNHKIVASSTTNR